MIDFLKQYTDQLQSDLNKAMEDLPPKDRVMMNRLMQQNMPIATDQNISFDQKMKKITESFTETLKSHAAKNNG